MTTSSGHSVSIGERSILIPSGWNIRRKDQVTLCWNYKLKGRIMLFDGGEQRLEDIPIEGRRTPFHGKVFSGHLEEGVISPSVIQRVVFRRRPHYRFEWVIQHDSFSLVAVYLAELDEDRPSIKNGVEELLHGLEIDA